MTAQRPRPPAAPRVGFVSLGCPKALVDSEQILTRLKAGPTGVLPLAVPRLVAGLAERRRPLVIVLDDVHHLRSRGALDVLRALCDHARSEYCVVLSGRRRPPIPVARLRAQGRLWELRASDLRMTEDEGRALLRAAGAERPGSCARR